MRKDFVSGIARGDESPTTALVAVFGVPAAAAALAALGVAPATVAAAAWAAPALALAALVAEGGARDTPNPRLMWT